MRRESKPEIEVSRPVSFALGMGDDLASGSIVRLSVAGVEIESADCPAEGREVFLRAKLVDGEGEVVMHGRVQWSRPGRFAVQLGSLGVRASRAIVRATRGAA